MPIYQKSPKALLLDKINASNLAPRPLTETNCIIDSPVAIPETSEGFNTEVTVRGIQYRGFTGSVKFRYRRLDLALLFKNTPLIVDAPRLSQVSQALPNINARYGLNLVWPGFYNDGFVNGGTFVLRAAAENLMYIGAVQGRYLNAGYRLQDVIYQRNLDVLEHPISAADVELGYKSGGMMAFGIDFTEEASIIEAVVDGPMGTGVNFTSGHSTALLQTLVGYGLPTWDFSAARIDHYNQGVVAKANPMYGRVAVISGIVDNNVRGPIYLHYNLL